MAIHGGWLATPSTPPGSVPVKTESSILTQSLEDESPLHTTCRSRKRKARFCSESTSDESNSSDMVAKKKKRLSPIWYLNSDS